MTPQKRNKIIILSAVLVMILSILLLITQNFRSDVYVQKKIASQCEQLMKSNNLDYQICKVEPDNKIIAIDEQRESTNPEIKPGDTVVFSLNLPQLMKNNTNDYVRNALSAINDTDKIRICLNIYPIIVREDLPPPMFVPLDISSSVIKDFYNTYNWNVFMTTSILDNKTKGDNFICTKVASLKSYSRASVIFTIPPEAKLILSANSHSRNYGIKISLIPPSLVPSLSTPEMIAQSASQFIPFFVLTFPINFK